MKKFGVMLVAVLAFAVLTAMAGEKPFEGGYLLFGDADKLLEGDKILVESFLSPVCPGCYLMWKNEKPLGPDVELKTYYLFNQDHGELPVSLLLIARDIGHEKEEETLKALFTAHFEQKVNTEDPEILAAIATSVGLGDAWAKKKDSPELRAKLDELAAFLKERGVERTPRIFVNKVVSISGGTCKCQGDELPAVVEGILDKVRQYRAKNK